MESRAAEKGRYEASTTDGCQETLERTKSKCGESAFCEACRTFSTSLKAPSPFALTTSRISSAQETACFDTPSR